MPISRSSAQTRTNVSPAFFERNARRVRRVEKWSKKFQNWHAVSTMIVLFAYFAARDIQETRTWPKENSRDGLRSTVLFFPFPPSLSKLRDVHVENVLLFSSPVTSNCLTYWLRRDRGNYFFGAWNRITKQRLRKQRLCRYKLCTIVSHLCALSKRLNTHRN